MEEKMTGKWYLTFVRLTYAGEKITKRELKALDRDTAMVEARDIYLPIEKETRRQLRAPDPVTDPKLVYEEPIK